MDTSNTIWMLLSLGTIFFLVIWIPSHNNKPALQWTLASVCMGILTGLACTLQASIMTFTFGVITALFMIIAWAIWLKELTKIK